VPYPIQSGSITDRLRKFFRIRGRTAFALDEIVAPVVMVQDLTKGPYQAGVTPAAGESKVTGNTAVWSIAVVLNDKAGSITPVLGNEFDGRTFSFTYAEIQNLTAAIAAVSDLFLRVAKRSDVVAAGVPTNATNLFVIQNGNGTQTVPVEIFVFDSVAITGGNIWRGSLGDNANTLGAIRAFNDIQPNITIGPNDALIFGSSQTIGPTEELAMAFRGFYQEQPA